jgi:hypothetical protein
VSEVATVEAARSTLGPRRGTLFHTHPLDPALDVKDMVRGINQVGAETPKVIPVYMLQGVAASNVWGSSPKAFNLATDFVPWDTEGGMMACGVENMTIVPTGSMAAAAAAAAAAGHGLPATDSYSAHYDWTTQSELSGRA